MPLTDKEVRNIKPASKIRKLSDGHGLQLWVMPSGGKLWRYAYRHNKKQKLLAVGAYPLVGLKQARETSENARRQRLAGTDPSYARREERINQLLAATFKMVADEYVAKLKAEGRAASTISKVEWLISLAFKLHSVPIGEMSAQQILEVLKHVENRGRYETAKRLRSTISSIFCYTVATGRAKTDPTLMLRGALIAPIVKHRPAITDVKRFKALLSAIDDYDGSSEVRIGLKLLAYLFPRPGELRAAEWPEIDFQSTVWTIPAARMKMRREHKVPLAPPL